MGEWANGCTENPVDLVAEDIETLIHSYKLMMEAFEAPVLNFEDIA